MTKRTDGPSAEVRLRVFKRDRFTCVYCGTTGAESELEADHIHPVCKGGSHHISNLVTACRRCNQKKGSGELKRKTPSDFPVEQNATMPVGLFVHMLKDGLANYQGRIIGIDGDTFFVQLFSAMTGDPTDVRPYDKAFIYGADCRLYAEHSAWVEAYDKDCEKLLQKLSGGLA